jgi:hypothetical protein
MTACHVVKEIAQLDSHGGWALKQPTYIDFGWTIEHKPSQEFTVKGVSVLPSTRGFDVALLDVSTSSNDGTSALPPALAISTQHTSEQEPIAIIGYPALTYDVGIPETRQMIEDLKRLAPGNAKFIAQGAVIREEPRSSFHVFSHFAGTHAGNSGSPVFSTRSPIALIGLHYCCTGLDGTSSAAIPGDQSDCSSIADSVLHVNEAISSVDFGTLVQKLARTKEPSKQQLAAGRVAASHAEFVPE